ncbi:CRISPR-associated protein Cas2 [Haemophilus influenzae]|uniref:CRISPR-associated protein Cas2 n=1 Tax=Haemophilus influenzae TaxID=727 RepID=UPI000CFE785C|nr:CRISPR-associated protein Cas2 [Haemophilus influenzae]MCK8793532.1 CRISPR-associated protein Cas2 [Haemophilus influenzae]MCK8848302.1 CRISPR-associated protein Cas2 [Haemophilus influenzae]MCK9082262.1 CRISPR-associated protein Cas2 [Haemophilus influenzae]PRI58774.1 hypothetical protein BVZ82_01705 [Haemophilus influenzae]PRI59402.1 hypothetical protein BVZ85_01442 [Haemophilus influenzae]
MKNILIAYDLNKTGQAYDSLIQAIESYKYYGEIQRSVWYIKTNQTATAVKDYLSLFIDKNDSLFVCEMIDCDWFGIYPNVVKYIQDNW